ncbi:MFS transporter [Streptomyces sp. NPDC056948]|uniref:MFS transporter n=1 Tax=Streptomyces sp. NPDC056948 TaxID=3345975 RepID=UPI00363479AB
MSGVFRRFLTATAVSDTANGVFAVAATITAAAASHSAMAVAAVTVAATLPWLIVAVPAGVLVDRIGAVRAVTLANLGRCVAMFGLAGLIWADVALEVTVPVLVFVVSCLQTVVDTAAEVVTANAVDDSRRTRANGLLAVSTRLFYQFLGPALAGVLVDVDHVLPSVLSGAACLAAALVAAQLPRTEAGVRSDSDEGSTGFWDGARIVFSKPILATIVAVGGLTTIANSIFFTLLVVYAITPGPLGLSASQYGFLVGAIGVGAAVGAVMTHRVERWLGRSMTLTLTRVGWALVFAGPLFAEGFLLTAVMTVGSALGGMWSVESMSVRQLTVSRADLGRVSGASRMLTYGMTPVGSAIGGTVALAVDAQVLFAVSTALTLLTIIPIRAYLSDRAIEAATRRPEPDAEKVPVSDSEGDNTQ